MGAGSRKRRKDKRKADKARRKAANKAMYEARRDAGQNRKSKRNRLASKRRNRTVTSNHVTGPCGNIGCMKCSSVYAINGPLHHLKVQHEENKKKNAFFHLPKAERKKILAVGEAPQLLRAAA